MSQRKPFEINKKMNEIKNVSINDVLPADLILHVLSFLPVDSIALFEMTSKTSNQWRYKHFLWQEKFKALEAEMLTSEMKDAYEYFLKPRLQNEGLTDRERCRKIHLFKNRMKHHYQTIQNPRVKELSIFDRIKDTLDPRIQSSGKKNYYNQSMRVFDAYYQTYQLTKALKTITALINEKENDAHQKDATTYTRFVLDLHKDYYNRGMLLIEMEKYDQAYNDFMTCKSIAGSEITIKLDYDIGVCLMKLDRYEEAISYFKNYLNLLLKSKKTLNKHLDNALVSDVEERISQARAALGSPVEKVSIEKIQPSMFNQVFSAKNKKQADEEEEPQNELESHFNKL